MFERYLSSVLYSKFGEFVDGLDPHNVRLDLWRGRLHYSDLTVRPDTDVVGKVLERGGVRLRYARVGSLDVEVPWRILRVGGGGKKKGRGKKRHGHKRRRTATEGLAVVGEPSSETNAGRSGGGDDGDGARDGGGGGGGRRDDGGGGDGGEGKSENDDTSSSSSSPTASEMEMGCTVVLSDVHVLLSPSSACASSDDIMKDREEQIRSLVEELLAERAREAAALLPSSSAEPQREEEQPSYYQSFKDGYLRSVLARVLSTLSVTVRNVHVRYQHYDHGDGWDGGGRGYAFGITLRALTVQTAAAPADLGKDGVTVGRRRGDSSTLEGGAGGDGVAAKGEGGDGGDDVVVSASASASEDEEEEAAPSPSSSPPSPPMAATTTTPPTTDDDDDDAATSPHRTTDLGDDGNPTNDDVGMTHKVAAVYQLAVYWDPCRSPPAHHGDTDDDPAPPFESALLADDLDREEVDADPSSTPAVPASSNDEECVGDGGGEGDAADGEEWGSRRKDGDRASAERYSAEFATFDRSTTSAYVLHPTSPSLRVSFRDPTTTVVAPANGSDAGQEETDGGATSTTTTTSVATSLPSEGGGRGEAEVEAGADDDPCDDEAPTPCGDETEGGDRPTHGADAAIVTNTADLIISSVSVDLNGDVLEDVSHLLSSVGRRGGRNGGKNDKVDHHANNDNGGYRFDCQQRYHSAGNGVGRSDLLPDFGTSTTAEGREGRSPTTTIIRLPIERGCRRSKSSSTAADRWRYAVASVIVRGRLRRRFFPPPRRRRRPSTTKEPGEGDDPPITSALRAWLYASDLLAVHDLCRHRHRRNAAAAASPSETEEDVDVDALVRFWEGCMSVDEAAYLRVTIADAASDRERSDDDGATTSSPGGEAAAARATAAAPSWASSLLSGARWSRHFFLSGQKKEEAPPSAVATQPAATAVPGGGDLGDDEEAPNATLDDIVRGVILAPSSSSEEGTSASASSSDPAAATRRLTTTSPSSAPSSADDEEVVAAATPAAAAATAAPRASWEVDMKFLSLEVRIIADDSSDGKWGVGGDADADDAHNDAAIVRFRCAASQRVLLVRSPPPPFSTAVPSSSSSSACGARGGGRWTWREVEASASCVEVVDLTTSSPPSCESCCVRAPPRLLLGPRPFAPPPAGDDAGVDGDGDFSNATINLRMSRVCSTTKTTVPSSSSPPPPPPPSLSASLRIRPLEVTYSVPVGVALGGVFSRFSSTPTTTTTTNDNTPPSPPLPSIEYGDEGYADSAAADAFFYKSRRRRSSSGEVAEGGADKAGAGDDASAPEIEVVVDRPTLRVSADKGCMPLAAAGGADEEGLCDDEVVLELGQLRLLHSPSSSPSSSSSSSADDGEDVAVRRDETGTDLPDGYGVDGGVVGSSSAIIAPHSSSSSSSWTVEAADVRVFSVLHGGGSGFCRGTGDGEEDPSAPSSSSSSTLVVVEPFDARLSFATTTTTVSDVSSSNSTTTGQPSRRKRVTEVHVALPPLRLHVSSRTAAFARRLSALGSEAEKDSGRRRKRRHEHHDEQRRLVRVRRRREAVRRRFGRRHDPRMDETWPRLDVDGAAPSSPKKTAVRNRLDDIDVRAGAGLDGFHHRNQSSRSSLYFECMEGTTTSSSSKSSDGSVVDDDNDDVRPDDEVNGDPRGVTEGPSIGEEASTSTSTSTPATATTTTDLRVHVVAPLVALDLSDYHDDESSSSSSSPERRLTTLVELSLHGLRSRHSVRTTTTVTTTATGGGDLAEGRHHGRVVERTTNVAIGDIRATDPFFLRQRSSRSRASSCGVEARDCGDAGGIGGECDEARRSSSTSFFGWCMFNSRCPEVMDRRELTTLHHSSADISAPTLTDPGAAALAEIECTITTVTTAAVTTQASATEAMVPPTTTAKKVISVNLHRDCYVEWNPETLVRVQRALRTPVAAAETGSSEIVVEAVPPSSGGVIDDLHVPRFDDESNAIGEDDDEASFKTTSTWSTSSDRVGGQTSSEEIYFDAVEEAQEKYDCDESESGSPPPSGPTAAQVDHPATTCSSEIRFQTARKLRVRLNKCANAYLPARRLVTARLDALSVTHTTKSQLCGGGSRTVADLINFTVWDDGACADGTSDSSTLYGQILGPAYSHSSEETSPPPKMGDDQAKATPKPRRDLFRICYESFPRPDPDGEGEAQRQLSDDHEMHPPRITLVQDACSGGGGEEETTPPTASSASSGPSDGGYPTKQTLGVVGCDSHLRLHFASPTRVVYMQQLIMEVVDYFFEGIIGFEVLGGKDRPPPLFSPVTISTVFERRPWRRVNNVRDGRNLSQQRPRPPSDMSFLKFDITFDRPTVVLPVTYRSPQFMAISLTKLTVTNSFLGRTQCHEGRVVVSQRTDDASSFDRSQTGQGGGGRTGDSECCGTDVVSSWLQWYNTAHVTGTGMRIANHAGRRLSSSTTLLPGIADWHEHESGGERDGCGGGLTLSVQVMWPTGPLGPLPSHGSVVPRWNVACNISPSTASSTTTTAIRGGPVTRLRLDREDYALLTHFLASNIGEESRNMQSWIRWDERRRITRSMRGRSGSGGGSPVRRSCGDEGKKEEVENENDGLLVKFNYEIKDGPPTTYSVNITLTELCIDLAALPSSDGAFASIRGQCVMYELSKLTDRVLSQELSIGQISLTHFAGSSRGGDGGVDAAMNKGSENVDLLVPFDNGGEGDDGKQPPYATMRQNSSVGLDAAHASGTVDDGSSSAALVFTSTSHPSNSNNSNVKTLTISSSIINADVQDRSYWLSIKDFFSDLPQPVIYTVDRVKSSMQIGDRWYFIGGTTTTTNTTATATQAINASVEDSHSSHCSSIGAQTATQHSTQGGEDDKDLREEEEASTFQFRLVLRKPLAILIPTRPPRPDSYDGGSAPSPSFIVRLSLDYLYTHRISPPSPSPPVPDDSDEVSNQLRGSGNYTSHDVLVSQMEVTTTTAATRPFGADTKDEQRILHPFSFGLRVCRDDTSFSTKIIADVCTLRLRYSDLSKALDAGLSLVNAPHGGGGSSSTASEDSAPEAEEVSPTNLQRPSAVSLPSIDEDFSSMPQMMSFKTAVAARIDSLSILIVDDSRRHFAFPTKLLELRLGGLEYDYVLNETIDLEGESEHMTGRKKKAIVEAVTRLNLNCLHLHDYLQNISSPYRILARSNTGDSEGQDGCYDGNMSTETARGDFEASRNVPVASRLRAEDSHLENGLLPWDDCCMVHDATLSCTRWGLFTVSSHMASVIPMSTAATGSFRGVTMSRSSPATSNLNSKKSGRRRLTRSWSSFHVESSTGSSSEAPFDLIELKYVQKSVGGDDSTHLSLKLRSITVQWNPATVIACQRFLGRFNKEVNHKRKRLAMTSSFGLRPQARNEHQADDDVEEEYDVEPPKNVMVPAADFISNNSMTMPSPSSRRHIEEQSVEITLNQHNGSILRSETSIASATADTHAMSDAVALKQKAPLHASVEIDEVVLCLNKEHQNRRLLRASISGTSVIFKRDENGQLHVSGSVRDVEAYDPSYTAPEAVIYCEENRNILSVERNNESETTDGRTSKVLTFRFETYSKGRSKPPPSPHRNASSTTTENSAAWGVHTGDYSDYSIGPIDDYLSVKVGALKFIYIRDRTAELVDYLSNGLPGKGMGKTAQATKEFLVSRVPTRSAMSIRVDAPIIVVPRHAATVLGVVLRLGDVAIKSWFDERAEWEALRMKVGPDEAAEGGGSSGRVLASSQSSRNFFASSLRQIPECGSMDTSDSLLALSDKKDWWRCLSLSILGMGHDITRDAVDLHVVLRKPIQTCGSYSRTTIIRGKLSYVETVLSYTDWALFWAIVKDNVGKPVDSSMWDNVEKQADAVAEAEKRQGQQESEVWAARGNGATQPGGFADKSTSLNEDIKRHDQDNSDGLNGGRILAPSTTGVAYAEDARFIRYGIERNTVTKQQQRHGSTSDTASIDGAGNLTSTAATLLELSFEMGGLCLTLHRNDRALVSLDDTMASDAHSVGSFFPCDDESSAGGGGGGGGYDAFNYDLTRLRVNRVVIDVKSRANGKQSIHISLYRLDLFDLGDVGRNTREIAVGGAPRSPCAFSVLAEGYGREHESSSSSSSVGTGTGAGASNEKCFASPQLVVTVNKSPGRDPVARVVVNYLSLNAMVRPILEVLQFLTCAWPAPELDATSPIIPKKEVTLIDDDELLLHDIDGRVDETNMDQGVPTVDGNGGSPSNKVGEEKSKGLGFSIKLVAHYPRLFFLADESDPFSRALVLRGLAVVNLTVAHEDISGAFYEGQGGWRGLTDVRTVKKLNAQLHSMESYINPNVDGALGPDRLKHKEKRRGDASNHNAGSDISQLGVALIEPVTAKFEFSQTERDLFPTSRVISVSMEPVSTIVSFGDINLIESVGRRWILERKRVAKEREQRERAESDEGENFSDQSYNASFSITGFEEPPLMPLRYLSTETTSLLTSGQLNTYDHTLELATPSPEYDVVFNNSTLGLVLRKAGGAIIVDDVQMPEYRDLVSIGDCLVAMAGEPLANKRIPFQSIVGRLETLPRPLRLTFRRSVSNPSSRCSTPVMFQEPMFLQEKSVVESSEAGTAENTVQFAEGSMGSSIAASSVTEPPPHEPILYTIQFLSGHDSGLRLEKSLCGDVSIVTGLNRGHFALSTACGDGFRHGRHERDDCAISENKSHDESSLDLLVLPKLSNDKMMTQGCVEIEAINGLNETTHIPKPGAVLLAINNIPTTGHVETIEILKQLSIRRDEGEELRRNQDKENLNGGAREGTEKKKSGITAGGGQSMSTAPRTPTDQSQTSTTYTITFLEAKSSDWSNLDQVEVACSGFNITLIDDINGRDMPIVKGGLNFVDIRLDRGMGLDTEFITTSSPSFLLFAESRNASARSIDEGYKSDSSSNYEDTSVTSRAILSKHAITCPSDATELILKIRGEAKTALDCYNARVALFEPLLEPCRLRMKLELQKGNADIPHPRPGHLAVVLSDGCSRAEDSGSNENRTSDCVCVNLTDAAAEMIIRAANDWKEWKAASDDAPEESEEPSYLAAGSNSSDAGKSLKPNETPESRTVQQAAPSKNDISIDQIDDVSLGSHPSARHKSTRAQRRRRAAQDAVKVALAFASKTKRTSSNETGSIAKPFVLRNRTGVSIAFERQTPLAQRAPPQWEVFGGSPSGSYRGLENKALARVIEDGKECKFSMDAVNDDSPSSDNNNNKQASTRVRTYDGQFPFLRIALDPSLGAIKPLSDLSVVKMGQTLRRLQVASSCEFLGRRTIRPIWVVWKVELENNRRVLTLASAICISSIGCGIPMEVGVKGQVPGAKQRATQSRARSDRRRSKLRASFNSSYGSLGDDILPVGLAKAGAPCFLPLWLGVSEKVSVHVRPASRDKEQRSLYMWSSRSILEFAPDHITSKVVSSDSGDSNSCSDSLDAKDSELMSNDMKSTPAEAEESIELMKEDVWKWKPLVGASTESVGRVCCHPHADAYGRQDLLTIWLTCGVESPPSVESGVESLSNRSSSRRAKDDDDIDDNSLCLLLGASLSLRNLLPVDVEWEIVNGQPPSVSETPSFSLLDGSSLRNKQYQHYGYIPLAAAGGSGLVAEDKDAKLVQSPGGDVPVGHDARIGQLRSGWGVEVFACDTSSMVVHARFRFRGCDGNWSQWAMLSLPDRHSSPQKPVGNAHSCAAADSRPDGLNVNPDVPVHPVGHEITVQCLDGSRTPVRIGLRIQSKSPLLQQQGTQSDAEFGMDVVLFSELWIRNLTSLPLVFGCPSTQMFGRNKRLIDEDGESLSDSAGKLAAEAALLEIASVLEFGDRGREINVSDYERTSMGDVYILPHQQANECWEEVFEYIEVESSCVKRRWWASERHDSCRKRPLVRGLPDRNEWRWDDAGGKGWKIDSSGYVSKEAGGWESCQNLVGSRESTFGGRRTFDADHLYRRRRWFRRRVRVNCFEQSGGGVEKAVTSRKDVALSNASSFYRHAGTAVSNPKVMFHQPVLKSWQRRLLDARASHDVESGCLDPLAGENGDSVDIRRGLIDAASGSPDEQTLTICLKCGDGRWSAAVIPRRGNSNGILRVAAARWHQLCGRVNKQARSLRRGDGEGLDEISYASGSLSPALYEFSYNVTVLGGAWGEFSRIMTVSPRFLVRNDSEFFCMFVKQLGASDESALKIGVGEIMPFYWADCRLPELVCVRPVVSDRIRNDASIVGTVASNWDYQWSGGIDMCTLGMAAIRVRKKVRPSNPFLTSELAIDQHRDAGKVANRKHTQRPRYLRTVRGHVEIRPGTGGSGITFSLKEEDPKGEGSLFRIENRSPFPLWIAQNGLLANFPVTTQLPPLSSSTPPPEQSGFSSSGTESFDESEVHADINGDMIAPDESIAFGLDAPYRRGKHGRDVSHSELHLVRVALAPLNSKDGIESTKVFGLTTVNEIVRLGPSKLRECLDESTVTELLGVRVIGVVCADGPTRVVRFCLMYKAVSASGAIGDVVRRHAKQGESYLGKISDGTSAFERTTVSTSPPWKRKLDREVQKAAANAALMTVELLRQNKLPTEGEARYRAYYGKFDDNVETSLTKRKSDGFEAKSKTGTENSAGDQVYVFQASFKGFLFSLVDSEPSEIAVASLRSLNAFASWNSRRTTDAKVSITVGWLQVDNHCPSAPYPVAVCPVKHVEVADDASAVAVKVDDVEETAPFLSVSLSFAPKHSSGISCLRSVVVAPRDLVVAVDLAFIVRVQRFLVGVQEHLERSRGGGNVSIDADETWAYAESKETWPSPDLMAMFEKLEGAAAAGVGSREIYFEGLTLLPCNINLSVSPARALTKAQATHEGVEAAAIHAAVRKGDLLVTAGAGAGVLGVKIGSKNRTTLAVIRGVFKNILFDALLRCDSAGLNFPGVMLRNHISNGPQLKTYLAAHYLAALRSNVPALLGSLAAFGNPVGLMRGLGDGVSDFVSEPIKGFKKSVKELDPTFVVDGVARGTGSLARHTVGGFADSASLLTETLSKNMAVLTLDRKYAQRRDRGLEERSTDGGFVEGVGSGGIKLAKGVFDGVTGVVRAPIRGAEKSGVEGFAKGVGKGLIGLVVKPVIGLSDAATEVMIGVKESVEKGGVHQRGAHRLQQIRPRRAFYGEERAMRLYNLDDALALALMTKTKLAGEQYLNHYDLGTRVALFSNKRFAIVSKDGRGKQVQYKYKNIKSAHVLQILRQGGDGGKWGVSICAASSGLGSENEEFVTCKGESSAVELCSQIQRGINMTKANSR